jgi:hypothetical protein
MPTADSDLELPLESPADWWSGLARGAVCDGDEGSSSLRSFTKLCAIDLELCVLFKNGRNAQVQPTNTIETE